MTNSSNISDNSIWPNGLKKDDEGYAVFYPLGTNKVDISTITWPEGDTLISPFVYKNDKLVGFVDTKALIVSGNTTTTMDYSHIEADFSSIKEGTLTINAPNATVKEFRWAVAQNNDGSFDYIIIDFNTTDQETIDAVRSAYRVADKTMYDADGNVIGTWDTSKLEVGGIYDVENETTDGLYCNTNYDMTINRGLILTEYNSDLSSLTDGCNMFLLCSNLTTFTSNLSSLTDGRNMFLLCSNLTTFTSNLGSLTNGSNMFSTCSNLTTFTSNLSSLTDGSFMFYYCSNLTTFSSNLSSLTNGTHMFDSCKLDSASVKNIIDTINTVQSGILKLGIGCDNNTTDNELFAQEVGYADMTSLLAALQAKGWNVDIQYTGRPTSTYGLRRPSTDTLPIFVKLEETEERADYTSLDESKKFILDYFHETTGSTDGYTQFNSLEEAIETLNIKPIEN